MENFKHSERVPDINNRFIQILEEKGYTGYKFSKEMSLSESVITNIRNGKNEPSKKYTNALLEKFPDVSMVWLLTGEGEMLKVVGQEKSSEVKTDFDKEPKVFANKNTQEQTLPKDLYMEMLNIEVQKNKMLEEQLKFRDEQIEFYKNKIEFLEAKCSCNQNQKRNTA